MSTKNKYGEDFIEFDTSNVLFILSGAFVGIEEIIEKYNNENISHSLIPRIYINGRKTSSIDTLNNLIDNGLKYDK